MQYIWSNRVNHSRRNWNEGSEMKGLKWRVLQVFSTLIYKSAILYGFFKQNLRTESGTSHIFLYPRRGKALHVNQLNSWTEIVPLSRPRLWTLAVAHLKPEKNLRIIGVYIYIDGQTLTYSATNTNPFTLPDWLCWCPAGRSPCWGLETVLILLEYDALRSTKFDLSQLKLSCWTFYA